MDSVLKFIFSHLQYWTNLRLGAKQERARFLTDLRRTGHDTIDREMSEIDERISSIFGHFGSGVNLGMELGFTHISYANSECKILD